MMVRLLCALALLVLITASGCQSLPRGNRGNQQVGCTAGSCSMAAAAGPAVAATPGMVAGTGPGMVAPTAPGMVAPTGQPYGNYGSMPQGYGSVPQGYGPAPQGYGSPQGPMGPQVGYPYYTTRGPRDFFTNNPPSIGN